MKSTPVTRRDALRSVVLFSSGMLASRAVGPAIASPPAAGSTGHRLDVLALGDFGTNGDASQVAVATQMARFAGELKRPLAAVLSLGDNFYGELQPSRFDDHFEKMYSSDALDCPFYACLGNHDYEPGKAAMQLAYASDHPTSRWKMPAKWYTAELADGDEPLVKLIVLDSNIYDGALSDDEQQAQRTWLEAELARPRTAPWLWVTSHFPMYSDCSRDDRGDNQRLIDEWGELFHRYKVDLYFAGHDHDLQHLRIEGSPTSFIVSGGGGAGRYECRPSERGFAEMSLGFNHIAVTPSAVDVQFISADGRRLYAFTQDRQGRVTAAS